MTEFHVRTLGAGPRVVLVHGSVANGASAWSDQLPLAARFRLVVPDRPGFPPNPPVERIDFEEHAPLVAELLEDGAHLVGHGYGGVVSLLVAAARPEAVRSLTVVEPPAFAVARGDPAVDAFVVRLARHWATGPDDPRLFLQGFLQEVSGRRPIDLPTPMSRELEQGALALMVERGPWEAQVPLEALARAPFPKLVVSGGHHAAFEAVADVLERELGAERAVLRGAGHTVQRAAGFNDRLTEFLVRASS